MVKKTGAITLIIVIFAIILILDNLVSAADVAYIYKRDFKIDKNILNVFNSSGLTVDLIKETNIPRTFDNYKFIFVGDEKFTDPTKIPINKYPSIIANYYHADTWGLTDNEGVSLLAQNSPLSVKKDGKMIQVYNRAIAPDGKAIQYYYLDIENIVSSLTPVAYTEVTSSGSKFGEVIAYANPGSIMANGKVQAGKLCFFGIIESNYWTTGGKNLFNECTGFVASQCTTDNDCSSDTTDSQPFCQDGDVYKKRTSFTCDTSRVIDSCVPKNNSILVQECQFGCNEGQCIPGIHDVALVDFNNAINKIRIEDANNTDILGDTLICNEKYKISVTLENKGNFTENVTFVGNVGNVMFSHLPVTDILPKDKKLKTKTVSLDLEEGNYNISVEAIINDDNFFSNNVAKREVFVSCPTVKCNNDLDCNDNNVSTEDRCINPGTINSVCENLPIECFFDSECGTDGFFGNNSCVDKNLTRNYRKNTCNNPGTGNSFCSTQNEVRTLEVCNDLCLDGECRGIICDDNSDCEDFNPLTKDECINPGTLISECRNSELNCASNVDCGFTGFIGTEFCSQNDIVKNFQNATCLNPGTPKSACSIEVSDKIIAQCQNTCSQGLCIRCSTNLDCNDNNPNTNDICNLPGTPESSCSNIPNTPEIACSSDIQCGSTQILSQPFCSLNSVNQLQRTWKCNNPGTQQSFCESKVEQQKLQQCSNSCSNGRCLNIRCTTNSDCNDNNPNTNDICNNPGTEQSYCSNDNNRTICYSDSDCGIDNYISQNICSGSRITRLFQDFTCANPGTLQSFCSSNLRQDTLQICDFTCSNGQCINPPQCIPTLEVCDSIDNDCDDQVDENNVCPTPPSCTNECGSGEKICSGNGYKICGDFDSDSCLEFSAVTNCMSNEICSNGQCVNQPTPECSDGLDNDHDSFIDYPSDPGCSNGDDNSELPVNPRVIYQCDDGIDNDGDHLIDFPADAGCSSRTDNSELPVNNPTPTTPQCDDGIDNDGDHLIDYPADPGCVDRNDNSELPVNKPQCDDGIDNDHDGKIDFPIDPQCSSRLDNNERA